MYHPGRSGAVAEMLVAQRVLELGGNVALPVGNHTGWDLITEFDGVLKRVQVKRAYFVEHRDRWEADVRRPTYKAGASLQDRSPVEAGLYDVLIVVADQHCYLFPVDVVAGRNVLTFRPPECRQRIRGVRPQIQTEDYVEAWPLLKEV